MSTILLTGARGKTTGQFVAGSLTMSYAPRMSTKNNIGSKAIFTASYKSVLMVQIPIVIPISEKNKMVGVLEDMRASNNTSPGTITVGKFSFNAAVTEYSCDRKGVEMTEVVSVAFFVYPQNTNMKISDFIRRILANIHETKDA